MGEDKSYKANLFKEGFSFLGIFFKDKQIKMDNQKLQKKISKLFEIARESKTVKKYVKKTNLYLDGLTRYYLKVLDENSSQFIQLQNALIDASAQFVYLQKKSGNITTKKAFKEPFNELYLLEEMTITQKKETIERIVSKGFEKYLASKSYTEDTSKINRKKQKYAKSFATSSVLYVSQFAAYVGVSKNAISVKVKGRIVAKIPKKQCEHIIIAGKAISLSSNLVYLCAQENIAIDFVDNHDKPFASLLSFRGSYAKMALLQLELLEKKKNIELAKEFIKGKSKNQLNYLKYLDRYHDDVKELIEKMELKISTNIKNSTTIAQLMGYEGELSTLYWQALVLILKDKSDFQGRINKGAKDLVNSALNYGYALLYATVQHSLLKAGLALHISFLHSLQDGKPTLVYDMVEEFRSFVVDRAIVSMINKNEPIKVNSKGFLDDKSKELIVKNVKERLGVYTKHKKESKQVKTIIQDQAYLLARHVRGEEKYKPFIGKY